MLTTFLKSIDYLMRLVIKKGRNRKHDLEDRLIVFSTQIIEILENVTNFIRVIIYQVN